MGAHTVWFDEVGMDDVARVGGKNASLGEMIRHLATAGVSVPPGFATTASAYAEFLNQENLAASITETLAELDVEDIAALQRVGEGIRGRIRGTALPAGLEGAIREAYARLERSEGNDCPVAVRSSATAEDLPEASFAGQQETYLNVRGIDAVLKAVIEVFASLFNDRAIAYRVHQGFSHESVLLSAGVQKMVRSDLGSSGVMFTLDTETGFPGVIFITSAWGLGETVIQGAVNPDEFYVFKTALRAGRPAVIRRTLGSKTVKMVFSETGDDGNYTEVVEVEQRLRRTFSLSDDEITSLSHCPCDRRTLCPPHGY